MRTSLRVFTAAVSTLLLGALVTVLPLASPAGAVNGIHTIVITGRTCNEGTNPCNVTVTLQGGVNFGSTITATIESRDGTARAGQDYTAVSQSVQWKDGEGGTRTVAVNTTGDSHAEPNEAFTLVVANPVQAAAGAPATITIPNDDGTPPTLAISPNPAVADEGNGDNVRTVDVSVNNPTDIGMDVAYATTDGTATTDTNKGAKDYVPASGTLHWDAGDGSVRHINITVKGDALAEPDETFFVTFSNPNNLGIPSGNPAGITLRNDEAGAIPTLTVDPIADKTEGDSGATPQTVTVKLTPAAQQTVAVEYTTSNGTAVASADGARGDYETAKGTLTFPPGTTSKTFNVDVNGDTADEQDEIYHVTLSNAANAAIGDPGARDAKIVNDDFGQISTVPGTGGGPHTRIFGANGSDLGGFMAYGPDLTSGLHVGRGDFFKADGSVGADGLDEIITGPSNFGPRSNFRSIPQVRIFSTDGRQLASVNAYDPSFGGGVYVAAGNLDGDASNGDELVTGAGPGGGPHVRIWRVASQGSNNAIQAIGGFFAYDPGFKGGVRVAVGNEAGDGKDEIVTAAGPGGGPHVRVWTPTPDGGAAPNGNGFFAYDPGFTGGVSVAAAANRIVTGAGPGGGPHVRVFDGNGTAQGGGFFAYDPAFSGGVSVGLGNLDNTPDAEIVTGAGPGGGPHVKVFRQDGAMPFGGGFFAYDPSFSGGVEVAVSVAAVPLP